MTRAQLSAPSAMGGVRSPISTNKHGRHLISQQSVTTEFCIGILHLPKDEAARTLPVVMLVVVVAVAVAVAWYPQEMKPLGYFVRSIKYFKDVSREFDEFQVSTHLCMLSCWYL